MKGWLHASAKSIDSGQPARTAQADLSRYFLLWLISKAMNKHKTHNHTIPHFDALKIYSYGKHIEKKINYL